MKYDLLCAMPTRPLFHQVEKKTLEKWLLHMSRGFYWCADFKSVDRICIACTSLVLSANLIGL